MWSPKLLPQFVTIFISICDRLMDGAADPQCVNVSLPWAGGPICGRLCLNVGECWLVQVLRQVTKTGIGYIYSVHYHLPQMDYPKPAQPVSRCAETDRQHTKGCLCSTGREIISIQQPNADTLAVVLKAECTECQTYWQGGMRSVFSKSFSCILGRIFTANCMGKIHDSWQMRSNKINNITVMVYLMMTRCGGTQPYWSLQPW